MHLNPLALAFLRWLMYALHRIQNAPERHLGLDDGARNRPRPARCDPQGKMRRAATRATEGDMADPTNLPITDQRTKQLPDAGRLFEGLQGWQGPLPADVKRRLLALLMEPSQQTWNDAFTIVVQPKLTLWMAVQAVDPTFPRTSPRMDDKGRILWRIPDQLTIARALRYARLHRAP